MSFIIVTAVCVFLNGSEMLPYGFRKEREDIIDLKVC